jgi:hypothetical protein
MTDMTDTTHITDTSNMTGQPHYFGLVTRLEEHFGLEVDGYFFVTPVSQWSLKSFYNTCGDHRTFMDGLDKISKWKAVDRAIRSYSSAWFSLLDGELGQLRVEAIRKRVAADLTSEIIVTEERQLAQQKLRNRLRGELVCVTVSSIIPTWYHCYLLTTYPKLGHEQGAPVS